MTNSNLVNKKRQFATSAYNLAKYVTFFYVLYRTSLALIGFRLGRLNMVLFVAAFLLMLIADHGKLHPNKYLIIEFVLIIVTLATSFAVARNFTTAFTTIEWMTEALILGYNICRIVQKEKNVRGIVKVVVASALILSVFCILTGGHITSSGRLSVSEDMNVNTLGVFLMISIWASIYLFSTSKLGAKNVGMLIIEVVAFLYIIFMTGSRKSLIGSIIILGLWVMFLLYPYLKKYSTAKRFLFLGSAIIGVAVLGWGFGDNLIELTSVMQYRMEKLGSGGISETGRVLMMKDALSVFADNFLLGVGWNNYQYYSLYGVYSHSTYTEILACTGLTGGLIALVFFGTIAQNLIKMKSYDDGKMAKGMLIVLFVILLYDGAMQIIFYNVNLMLFLHIIVAYLSMRNMDKTDAIQRR